MNAVSFEPSIHFLKNETNFSGSYKSKKQRVPSPGGINLQCRKMNPITILYDPTVFTAQKYGGVSRIFYELIKNLADKEQVRLSLFFGFYINDYPIRIFKKKAVGYLGQKVPYHPRIREFLKLFNRFLFDTLA
jgi:hypothetical protein